MADTRIKDLGVIPYLDNADTIAVYDNSTTIDNKVSISTLATRVGAILGNANGDIASLLNKTIDADATGNSIKNIADASIKTAAGIDTRKIGNGDVTNTEMSYMSGVTLGVQKQIDTLSAQLVEAGVPQRSVTFQKTSSSSNTITITEAEIQIAAGLTESLLYSVRFDNVYYQVRTAPTNLTGRTEFSTNVEFTGQIDNSVSHLKSLIFTLANASEDYNMTIQFTTVNAS